MTVDNRTYSALHNHTDVSNIRLLDCIMTVSELIDYAHQIGLRGVAITDHASLSNHIKAISHLRQRRKENPEDLRWQNFKLILGEEIYLTRNGLNADNIVAGEKYYHFILLAKDEIGHKQIRQLSSKAWMRSFYRFMQRVPTYYSDLQEVIGADPGHVFASTACLGGYFAQTILEAYKVRKDPDQYDEHMSRLDSWIGWMISVFGKDNFFLEKQPSLNKEQWIVNRAIDEIAEKHGIHSIITTDAHYATEADRPVHKAYLNAKEGEREVDAFYSSTYIMNPEEITNYFLLAEEKYGKKDPDTQVKEKVSRDLENTVIRISDLIKEYDLAHSPIIPTAKLDWAGLTVKTELRKHGDRYPFINKFLSSPHEQDRYFISKILSELDKKYPNQSTEEHDRYLERIEVECLELWNISEKLEQRLSAYLLLIAEIIGIIWTEGDSLVGPGRGSSSGFLSNFLLDIIQIDPLQAEVVLPHWRFISEHRVSLPDIDIDIESGKRAKVMEALRKHYGEQHVINVATFGTEKPKSAIKTAARGLGVSDDEATYLSSMVPSERGFLWPLHDVFYGNEEEGRAPVKTFVHEMTDNYPELWTVAQKIEGLISRRGVHAAGVLISSAEFYEHNAIMKSPSGAWTSQYELQDTEYMGGVKLDLLSIDALDKIRVALDYLIEYGYVERQATLRDTYLSVLNPSDKELLQFNNPEIWDLAGTGTILSLFQLDTPVGMAAVKLIKPRDIAELSAINSLMRLMASEGEMPLDTFLRHRENKGMWRGEMVQAGLTSSEIELMEHHLGDRYGVAESQEAMMILAMDEKISGFTVAEADALRKAVSKKSFEDFDKMERLFYEKGRARNTSEALLSYVWEIQVKRQKGYSFSQCHTYVYSIIALQQLNLYHRFPSLFWNLANLIVDSGGIEAKLEDDVDTDWEILDENAKIADTIVEDDDDDDVEEGAEVPAKPKAKVKSKTVDYGKISMALGKMKSAGITIDPPDINRSGFTFIPDVEKNAILFGIKGIAGINDTIVRNIIDNRPYTSLDDLMSKVKLNKPQVVSLIKSGSLDALYGKDRRTIMFDYITDIADTKKTLNLRNMQMLMAMELIPVEMDFYRRLYNLNKYLKKAKQDDVYLVDEVAMRFFENNYDNGLLDVLDDGSFAIGQKAWDKMYTKGMDPMRDYIKANLDELLNKVNTTLFNEMWDKYANGTISKWEMDSLSFYDHPHELEEVNFADYGIENFFAHPEEAEITGFSQYKGRPIPLYRLWRIAGTVLNRDKIKHIVSILTPTGVVNVRIWQNQFVKYDKQISTPLPNGKKKVVEKSWFSRGNKIMFTGMRRGDNFFPKVYKKHKYPFPVELITGLTEDNKLILKGARADSDWAD